MNSVGERLKGERIRLKYSIRKFAEAAGVSLSAQQRYESDERVPDADYLNRISALNAEIFWIMSGSPEDDDAREKRAAMYPPEITELIEDYKLCPEGVQQSLRALVKNVADIKRKAIADFKAEPA